jgi:hypothetical protein
MVIKALGCGKMCIPVTLVTLADGNKLPPNIILNSKTMPRDYLQELPWDANLQFGWPMKQGCPPVEMWRAGLACIYETLNTRNISHNYWQFHYTDLIVIPGWMTKQLQVLDVAVNRLFKDHLKQQWSGSWQGTILWPQPEESRSPMSLSFFSGL